MYDWHLRINRRMQGLVGCWLCLLGAFALAQTEVEYSLTLTSDWCLVALRSEESWNLTWEVLEGHASNPQVVATGKYLYVSKPPYDIRRVVIKVHARLYGLRSNSWVWYLLEKGDIGSVALEVRSPSTQRRIALFTNALDIPDNPNNAATFYAEDDAHRFGVARKTVQYRLTTNSDWSRLALRGGQWFSNVQWQVIQGAQAPNLAISATSTELRISKRPYDTTPVEVLFTATLNGLVYGETVRYEILKGSLGQTTVRVYGAAGPTGARTEIARQQNTRSGGATNPLPFEARALAHAEWEDIVGAFFYPWYGNANDYPNQWRHWKGWGRPGDPSYAPPCTWAAHFMPDFASGFVPALELYSSNSPEVFRWQTQLMARAGIELGIVSWWGRDGGLNADGGYSDRVFNRIIHEWMPQPGMPPIKWAAYLEGGDHIFRDRNLIYDSIRYIVSRYGNSPHYARLYGAPLIFVYKVRPDEIAEFYAAVEQLWREGIIVYLNGDPPIFSSSLFAQRTFQAWHRYDPAVRTTDTNIPGVMQSRCVSPGFWVYYEPQPRLARSEWDYHSAVQGWTSIDARSNPTTDHYVQFLLITTWNEYNEGTQIEPAHRILKPCPSCCYQDGGSYGFFYVDSTANAVSRFKIRP